MGQPWAGISALFKRTWGDDFDADGFRVVWLEHFHALLEKDLRLKAGVTELLDVLDALGLPRAIATSSRIIRWSTTSPASISSGASIRWSPMATMSEASRRPIPICWPPSDWAVSPQDCLALEDSHNGIRSAHAAGMMAVMVPDLLAPTEEIEALCAHVAQDLLECMRFFEVVEAG